MTSRTRVNMLTTCLVAACILAVVTSCTKEADKSGQVVQAPSTVVTNDGQECFDATADILVDEHDDGRKQAEPAGIDIVAASALVKGGVLEVAFTTAGPIEGALDPEFRVFQGNLEVARDKTWELRASKVQGRWTVRLATFPPSGVEKKSTLASPVSVNGTELRYSVPKDDLPPIGTAQWLFGSSSGPSDDNRVFDECYPFAQTGTPGTRQGTGTTSPSGPAPTTSAPPASTGKIGTTLVAPDGSRVTVKRVEVPAVPNNGFEEKPVTGEQWAAAEVEVCAASKVLDHLGERRFTILMSDGRRIGAFEGAAIPKEPRLPIDESLRPNTCKSGWAAFLVSSTATATGVTYDAGGAGVGPVLTFET